VADSEKSKRVAAWATEPLEAFTEDHRRLGQMMDLAMRGISVLRAMPKALDALAVAVPEKYQKEEAERRKHDANELAQLAEQEVELGFPLLNAQSAVSLWGSLELLIRDLLVGWLQNQPDVLQKKAIA
jgi:hypothetical protein